MAKWFLRFLIVIILSFGFSYIPIEFDKDFLSGFYTVIGIMFPLALTLITSFTFFEVTNDVFVKRQRKQLKDIRNIFIILFSIATLFFLFKSVTFCISWKWVKFKMASFLAIYFLFCIGYFIRNFALLAILKDELDDAVRAFKIRSNKSDDI
jgi:hypothetical protein